ncbi:MAG: putative cell wall binding repeat 2-containing protein [Frankiales bacterium]|nr:putative cell wall binding repeat 2-containing protein [Frankiales bacterium]
MNRRTYLAATVAAAALVGTGVATATSAVMSTSAAPMVRTAVSLDSVVPALTLGCTTTNRAVVTSYARRPGGATYRYLLSVNGKVTHGGYATATPGGVVSAQTDVPNGATSTVKLLLDNVTASTGTVSPRCGLPALVAKTLSSAYFLARGTATAYTINKNANGTVTRWNPCDGAITVKVNPTGGGAGALADAQNAIKALRAGTGLDFVYDGTTTFVPRSTNRGSQPAKVVIAWGTRSQTDLLGAGAVGEGGWRSNGTSTNGSTWTWKIVSGFVVVDPTAHLTAGFGRGVTRGSVLLHELGHVSGLNHTSQTSQVMAPALSSASLASWGTGDKTGLGVVGASHGCVTAK